MLVERESRRCARCPVRLRGELRMRSGVLVEGESRDVSLVGLWFVTQRSLPVGNQVWVQLEVDREEEQGRIRTEGHVARIGEDGVGVAFTSIPAESLECLRSLMHHDAKAAGRVKAEPRRRVAASEQWF